jgi:hypothetical protein
MATLANTGGLGIRKHKEGDTSVPFQAPFGF